MRYEGRIFRPPSEAYSLIIQTTIGCSYNECTFCSMYKEKDFRVRGLDNIIQDLNDARHHYGAVDKIFLADGDALVLPTESLLMILDTVATLFPEVSRVSAYGSPWDVLRKSDEELAALRSAGLGMIYIGAESGSDLVLSAVKKGATSGEIIKAISMIEAAGIKASVTFISGLGGAELWEEHATATGRMITRAQPSYVGLLTLMISPDAPISREIENGSFKLLAPAGVIDETILMLRNANPVNECVFRSNHASNYLSLRGDLPADRDALIAQLEAARVDSSSLKDERFRML